MCVCERKRKKYIPTYINKKIIQYFISVIYLIYNKKEKRKKKKFIFELKYNQYEIVIKKCRMTLQMECFCFVVFYVNY